MRPHRPGRHGRLRPVPLHMVGVSVAQKDLPSLHLQQALLRLGQMPVTVAPHQIHGNVGKGLLQGLCVGYHVSQMKDPVGLMEAHRLFHMPPDAVGVGKYQDLHAITFSLSCT